MAVINENKMAKEISECEGKKEEMTIAQIKEVLRIALNHLANGYKMSEAVALIEKHRKGL